MIRKALHVAALIGAIFISSHSVRSAEVDVAWQRTGDGDWNDAANWEPALVPNNGADSYNVFIDSGNAAQSTTVSLDIWAKINDLTIDASDKLVLQGDTRFDIEGIVTNNGVIELTGISLHPTIIRSPADVTYTGSGRVVMKNATDVIASGRLTNGEGHTIEGTGFLGQNGPEIVNLAGGVIQADGPGEVLIVDPSPKGLFNYGLLRAANGGRLRLNGDRLGDFTNEAGGVISVESTVQNFVGGLRNKLGGIITGGGILDSLATAFVNEGTMAPGNGVGKLTFIGHYQQSQTGTLEIELGGTDPGVEHDQLAVSHWANLAGAIEVKLIDDYMPAYGDAFTILTHERQFGEFDEVIFPEIVGLTPLRLFYSRYRTTLAVVLDGDANRDGRIDLDDLNDVRNNFGASGLGVAGDTNYDDLVDLDDLNNVRNHFGTSIAVPVPEPGSLALAALCLLAVLAQRNRAAH